MRKFKRFFKFEGVLILVILYFIIFGLIDIIRLQHEKNQKTAEYNKFEVKYIHQLQLNAQLRNQYNESSEDKYVEQQARKMDYGYPEEHVFIDVSGNY
ncbi:MAG: hypothetical protein LBJ83_00240 [Oscillospiraceae bacterium]|nr:hypothetical protein [Oscillospiraceae bacterium]